MSEFEDKLNSILSSPEDMKKIMELANSLSSTSQSSSAHSAPHNSSASGAPSNSSENHFSPSSANRDGKDISGSDFQSPGTHGSPLDGIDPNIIKIMTKIMSSETSLSKKNENFLNALVPYLRPDRQSKLQNAIKIARFAKMAKIAMSEFGGGDFHF